jgi:hypothetical protein
MRSLSGGIAALTAATGARAGTGAIGGVRAMAFMARDLGGVTDMAIVHGGRIGTGGHITATIGERKRG